MTINQAVKALREGLGQSQQAFATNLGISISGLANYERDRIPPIELLVKFASLARESSQGDVENRLLAGVREQLTAAMKGQSIWFLSSSRTGEKHENIEGLLLLTIQGPDEDRAASDFFSAYTAAASGDEHERARGKRILAALHQARLVETKKK